jgi:hypothetical protein
MNIDDFCGVHNAQPRLVACNASHKPGQLLAVSDQDQFELTVFLQGRSSRAHDDLGAEVAAHGIK